MTSTLVQAARISRDFYLSQRLGTYQRLGNYQRGSKYGCSFPRQRSANITVHSCHHSPTEPDNVSDFSRRSDERPRPSFQAFSRLPNVAWDLDAVITLMVSYISIFHVPLGFGGLTILAQQMKVNDLDPETKAVALVFLILSELGGTIWLIRSSMKRSKSSFDCFNVRFDDASGSRGWVVTVLVGLAIISVAMGVTSVMDFLHMAMPDGGKAETVKQMISGSFITKISTFVVWCIFAPFLEEIVYRGYLLQAMASQFGWQRAVVLSSFIFTVAHLDVSGAPSLFFVGCVLGAAYAWSGNLASSLLIHSLYNAFLIYG